MVQAAVSGLIEGTTFALLGICLVLTFRMAGVLNFAQAAIGSFGAMLMLELHDGGVGWVPAVVGGIAAAAAISVLIGLVMSRWFTDATAETKASVSIALLVGLLALGDRLFGSSAHNFPAVLPTVHLTISGVYVSASTIIAFGFALVLAISLTLLLRRTRYGHRLRAIADRPHTAELLGIPVRWLTVGVWAFSGAVAGAAIILIAPVQSGQFSGLSLLVLPATAAALIGLFRSFWITFWGGIALGVATGVINNVGSLAPYHNVIPFAVLIVILVVAQRGEVWDAAR